MSRYFETVNFWVENLLDSTENYTIESNEKGKYVDITIWEKLLGKMEELLHHLEF